MRDGTEAAGFEKRQVSAERPRPVRRTEIPWSAVLSTLSDRIPLVRYAVRAALAENHGLACLPLSQPEASLPWKSPGASTPRF